MHFTSTTTTTTSTSSSTTSTLTTTTSTATSATSTSTLTTTTSTVTTTTATTTTTTETRVNAAPDAPIHSQASPKKLSKHYCQEVYAQADVFSDPKYDSLWDGIEDPGQSFSSNGGQALVEEFEYYALKRYRAKVKQCLDQHKDKAGNLGHRRAVVAA
ncbi:hypothetical protein HDU81_008121 [Chytriomyces hyalinus]|nr:hypothetical protein HDU81_008121 [Chytriomyces hyalinus]